MHYFIYANKDTWISSGSNHIDGTSYKDANFGQDEILEAKKEFWNLCAVIHGEWIRDNSNLKTKELSEQDW